jgi:phosphodiesterase/alkaline phosphatase D-like protein
MNILNQPQIDFLRALAVQVKSERDGLSPNETIFYRNILNSLIVQLRCYAAGGEQSNTRPFLTARDAIPDVELPEFKL